MKLYGRTNIMHVWMCIGECECVCVPCSYIFYGSIIHVVIGMASHERIYNAIVSLASLYVLCIEFIYHTLSHTHTHKIIKINK